jgi:hypothetical protein
MGLRFLQALRMSFDWTAAPVRRPARFAVVATAVEATQRSSEPDDANRPAENRAVGLFKLLARLFRGGDWCEFPTDPLP